MFKVASVTAVELRKANEKKLHFSQSILQAAVTVIGVKGKGQKYTFGILFNVDKIISKIVELYYVKKVKSNLRIYAFTVRKY